MRYRVLNKNREFTRAYSRGKSFVHPLLVTYVVKTRTKKLRVGITSSKKIGNAVVRNRARRVIRAAMAAQLPPTPEAGILCLWPGAAPPASKSWQLEKVMRRQLIAAGVLAPQDPENAGHTP